MISILRLFFSLVLTIAVLFTGTGLTIATHFCGGKAVAVGLRMGNGDIGCKMEPMSSSCENLKGISDFVKNGCCRDKYVELDTEDYSNSSTLLELETASSFDFYFPVRVMRIFISTLSYELFFDLPPPPLRPVQQALLQVFRI